MGGVERVLMKKNKLEAGMVILGFVYGAALGRAPAGFTEESLRHQIEEIVGKEMAAAVDLLEVLQKLVRYEVLTRHAPSAGGPSWFFHHRAGRPVLAFSGDFACGFVLGLVALNIPIVQFCALRAKIAEVWQELLNEEELYEVVQFLEVTGYLKGSGSIEDIDQRFVCLARDQELLGQLLLDR